MLDEVTSNMINIYIFYENLMYYIYLIVILVTYFIIIYSISFNISYKYLLSVSSIELGWTLFPAIILCIIAFPSFILIYTLDYNIDPELTINIIGKQWYWDYQYTGYHIYSSYLLPLSNLGDLRLLQVDNPLFLPVFKCIRLLITSSDVIHSFFLPNLGIKLDAIPGRINGVILYPLSTGTFYGQCTELCGTSHYAMPIVCNILSLDDFLLYGGSSSFLISYLA